MPWIKQYPTRLDDVRFMSLNDRQQLRYYQLYLLAGRLNFNGAFMHDGKQLSPKEIAHLLRVRDVDQLAKDISTLKRVGLLKANGHGPYISDFAEEQINWQEKQKDNRERQRKFKSRISNALVTRDADVSNALVTLLEKEEDSDKDIDKDSSLLYTLAVQKFADNKITLKDDERIALQEIIAHIKPEWIGKAIKVTLEKKKHSGAYVIGILRNWRDAHANNSSNNTQRADKPAQAKRSPSAAASAATSAAAKRALANKSKSNV